MKRQVKEFRDHVQQQQTNGNGASAAQTGKPASAPTKEKAGDYIDFEEVK